VAGVGQGDDVHDLRSRPGGGVCGPGCCRLALAAGLLPIGAAMRHQAPCQPGTGMRLGIPPKHQVDVPSRTLTRSWLSRPRWGAAAWGVQAASGPRGRRRCGGVSGTGARGAAAATAAAGGVLPPAVPAAGRADRRAGAPPGLLWLQNRLRLTAASSDLRVAVRAGWRKRQASWRECVVGGSGHQQQWAAAAGREL
jgi:hypothetical protein